MPQWILFSIVFYLSKFGLTLRYNTSSTRQKGDVLNVHIVCHTHDDVGWLKTMDQYYYGMNQTYQPLAGGVQYIIDSVVTSLAKNSDRKFIYVEQAFFQKWYEQQNQYMLDLVHKQVQAGQLEFINGGWVMHDEAATHFIGMIDQTTYGHTKILQQFGVVPKTGWQIDPFGHSATQASLLSKEVGFDSLFFARIDYQDLIKRKKEKTLEFIWQASPSLGNDTGIFTGVFPQGNYGPPPGLCFGYDTLQCFLNQPVVDDPESSEYNVDRLVDVFVKDAQDQATVINGQDIMFLMGTDFMYDNAESWFGSLDKLIHYVNKDGRVNAFYSTPTEYAKAKMSAGLPLSTKTDDFFPYADCPHCYWTGYFTSRPALKRFERVGSSYLQTSRQLELQVQLLQSNINSLKISSQQPLDILDQSIAILQHHDGVSGTSKQHVAFDYAKRVSKGLDQAEVFVNNALADSVNDTKLPLVQCRLLNETKCQFTESLSNFVVIVYNPSAQPRTEAIRLPVTHPSIIVTDWKGKPITSQVMNISVPTIVHKYKNNQSKLLLVFQVYIPALGHSTYFVQPGKTTSYVSSSKVNVQDVVLENNNLRAIFNTKTGRLESLENKYANVKVPVTQQWLYYKSAEDILEQASGAYIFRPSILHPHALPVEPLHVPELRVVNGSVVQEITVKIAPWITQIYRLYKNATNLEIEYTVGPIPTDECETLCGIEVISRYTTSIKSGNPSVFYTDSNGREMQQRTYNRRPTWELNVTEPVAGNYYPVNMATFIKDEQSQLSILTDRSQGAASLEEGSLELMVHRRINIDDFRGVMETLDETDGPIAHFPFFAPHRGSGLTITGRHYLSIHSPQKAASLWRPLARRIFAPVTPSFGPLDPGQSSISKWIANHLVQHTWLKSKSGLPSSLSLVTLQVLHGTSLLGQKDKLRVRIRLAHRFGIGEDAVLSKPVTINVYEILALPSGVVISSLVETSLTGNQIKNLKVSDAEVIGPMKIKTYELELE